MFTKITISTTYNSTLERAFKTPILCDVSKIHTGHWIMPRVTHCTNDEDWGQIGSSKKVYMAKSLTQKGGFASVDNVIDRIENEYWKIEVNQFQAWMLGFSKFVGEWRTKELSNNKIVVEYTYTLFCDIALLYPFNWLFTKVYWKIYMKQVTENIRILINNNEPYHHN